jgi:hypothetical protein
MTNEERLLAAMEYQQAMRAALGNQNLLRQGRRMNLPARQAPGALSEFVTKGCRSTRNRIRATARWRQIWR